MYRLALPLLFFTVSFAWAGDLELHVHGSGIAGKKIYVSVYDSAQIFPHPDDKTIKTTALASSDDVSITIPAIHNGEYAVAIFADMNGNNKLDSNFIGIPKEPVGVSRNAKGNFGPPKFADAAFQLIDGVNVMDVELK